MIDCILVHPGEQRAIYGDLCEEHTAIEPPVWARMIAGWLRDRGYKVRIIDQEAENLSPEQVAQKIDLLEPRLVAIVVFGHQPSASTQQMVAAQAVAKAIRGVRKVILGNHPSALPGQTLDETEVPYVCDGEGPRTIEAMLREARLEHVPGLVWRDADKKLHHNKPAPLIDIDDLHGDVWDLLPMDRYRAHNWQCLDGSPRQPYASIYTTLGCPYRCSFCMINVFQHVNRYRRRDPDSVVEQICKLYYKHGVSTIKIADEMFVLNPAHYTAICEGLARQPFADELNIWAYARVDTIKPETLKMLRSGGIRWLCLGIESGSNYVRDGAEKHLTDDDIRASVKAIQDAGINVLGNFIFGLPDDTLESMRATLDLAKSLDCEFVNFYSAMGYPGSKLHEDTDPAVLPASWSGYSQHSWDTTPLPTEALSSAEVLAFRDAAHTEFFSSPRYLEYVDKKFGSQAVAEIRSMTSRLPRKLLEAA